MKIYSFSTEGVAKEKYSACESETNSREVNPPICYPCCQSLKNIRNYKCYLLIEHWKLQELNAKTTQFNFYIPMHTGLNTSF